MKKLTMLFACALLLVVSGCSDASTNVSDSSEALITIDGDEITKGDVYEGLSVQGDISPITTAMDKQVVKVAVPVTDEIEKEGQASLASYKESIGDANWEEHLASNGYKDEEDFYKNSILLNIRKGKITGNYVTENFDKLNEEYKTRKLQIMVSDDKEKAKEAIAALKEKDDMSAAASKFGVTTTYNGSEGIYTNQSGIPSAVWNEILNTKDGKTFSGAILDSTTGNYYIVKVVSSNAKKDFKEDAINTIKNLTTTNEDGYTIEEVAYNYYLNKAGYSIHDANIYSYLLNNSKKYTEE